MVQIFKTNVDDQKLANKILDKLRFQLPVYLFNFDLEDCDRILRAESIDTPVEETSIIKIVTGMHVEICLFEDDYQDIE
jgi:hypothetical protein